MPATLFPPRGRDVSDGSCNTNDAAPPRARKVRARAAALAATRSTSGHPKNCGCRRVELQLAAWQREYMITSFSMRVFGDCQKMPQIVSDSMRAERSSVCSHCKLWKPNSSAGGD